MKVFGDVNKVEEYGTPHKEATDVSGVVVLGYDPAEHKWLAIRWNEQKTVWLAGGGKETSESYEQAAVRELKEETGYSKFNEQIQLGGPIISYYYNDKKAVHRRSYAFAFLFILDSSSVGEQELEDHEQFEVIWLDYKPLYEALERTAGGVEHWLAVLSRANDYVARLAK